VALVPAAQLREAVWAAVVRVAQLLEAVGAAVVAVAHRAALHPADRLVVDVAEVSQSR
jgi:hypothetical protein